MSVDANFATWLQAIADTILVTDAPGAARWGTSGRTIERTTSIATVAAAEAQANRELAFWSRGPFAIDVHQLVGTDWRRSIGQVVTLTTDELGYAGGKDVWVYEVEEDRATDISSVTVLRPLRDL